MALYNEFRESTPRDPAWFASDHRDGTEMKTRSNVLTKEERDILILATQHPGDRHLSNSEIAQRLGISVSRVKALTHELCVKLGANSRNEAILLALKQGELGVDEFLSIDDLAEYYSSLDPDTLRRIARLMRQEQEDGHLQAEDQQIVLTHRRPDGILTNRERDVIILVAHGLTNKEIADFLCMSGSAVRTFLNRAFAKLGARKRADAVVLALKKGEISIGDIFSLDEVLQGLAPLGPESIEKIAQMQEEKLGKKPMLTSS